jgi:hypothetical protein
MIIEFTRTGGFANVALRARIDTEQLPNDTSAEVQAMLTALGFFRLPSRIGPPHAMPDGFHYRVSVTDEQRTHTIDVEGSPEPPFGDLLTLLTRIAKQSRRSS